MKWSPSGTHPVILWQQNKGERKPFWSSRQWPRVLSRYIAVLKNTQIMLFLINFDPDSTDWILSTTKIFKRYSTTSKDECEISCIRSDYVLSHTVFNISERSQVPSVECEEVSELPWSWLPFNKLVSRGQLILRRKVFKNHQKHHGEARRLFKLHKLYSLLAVRTTM